MTGRKLAAGLAVLLLAGALASGGGTQDWTRASQHARLADSGGGMPGKP